MKYVAIVGIDIAKEAFQLHGAAADGSVVFRKKLSRGQLLAFLSGLVWCISTQITGKPEGAIL